MPISSKTKRLTVRLLTRADYKAWKLAHTSCATKKNMWDQSILPEQEMNSKYFSKMVKAYNDLAKKDKAYIFGIFLNSTGEYLGEVDILHIIRGKWQTGLLGIYLTNNHWGQGHGKDVASALAEIAFKKLNLHRLEGSIEAKNKRSVMLAKSVGLKKEGIKRKAAFIRGEWHDLVLYAATAEDFGIKWKTS